MSDKDKWNKEFGISYTRRNKINPINLIPFFKSIIPKGVKKILEVGCNRGHNLRAILYCGEFDLYGIDINPYSVLLARENKEITFMGGDVNSIPFKDNYFDMVITSGLLIHIKPDCLSDIISKLLRITSRYYLFLEYNDKSIENGKFKLIKDGNYIKSVGLWKGNYKQFVLDNFNVELLKSGEVGIKEGFGDNRNYYLFKKVNI